MQIDEYKCERLGSAASTHLLRVVRLSVFFSLKKATAIDLHSMPRSLILVIFLTLWLSLAINALCSFQDKCLAFTPETHIYNSTRTVLAYIAAGTNLTLPDNDPTCNRPSQVVAVNICRVGLSIPTSNRSSISFELWLPENWSDRFLTTGNGGIDGCMSLLRTAKQDSSLSILLLSEKD